VAALLGAALLVVAFPPFGWGWSVLPALVLFLWAVRGTTRPSLVGAIFAVGFYGGLLWWIGASQPGWLGYGALVLIQASFLVLLSKWVGGRRLRPDRWFMTVVGLWALAEFVRERAPAGGFSWGQVGYPLGEFEWLRSASQWVGVSGLGVLVVALAASVLLVIERQRIEAWLTIPVTVFVLLMVAGAFFPSVPQGDRLRVAVVQGSTPCPLQKCPDERTGTQAQHLALTRTIEAGSVDFVVWSESSAVAFRTEPEISESATPIVAEAARIGAALIAGSDVTVSDGYWNNANAVVDGLGRPVGEYHKQHPVPFGEYVPLRRFLGWTVELGAHPRDMLRGDGPAVFDLPFGRVGSVISFEGAFARYPRQHARAGAQLLVVATNEGGYGETPASDQFIGMTRMRAAELGMDVIHAAVTGKSTIITAGGVVGEVTPLAVQQVLYGTVRMREQPPTLYAVWGDWVQVLAVVGWVMAEVAWRIRRRSAEET
jgi:apolipoprotein N-acyltransferase